jgi:thioredoxin 1
MTTFGGAIVALRKIRVPMLFVGLLLASAYAIKQRGQTLRSMPILNVRAPSLPIVNDSTFEREVLNSKTPVVVDIWANWCSPCDAYAPVVESASKEYKSARFVAMNYDDSPTTVNNYRKYGLDGLPATLLIKDGELKAIHMGTMEKKELEKWIKKNAH